MSHNGPPDDSRQSPHNRSFNTSSHNLNTSMNTSGMGFPHRRVSQRMRDENEIKRILSPSQHDIMSDSSHLTLSSDVGSLLHQSHPTNSLNNTVIQSSMNDLTTPSTATYTSNNDNNNSNLNIALTAGPDTQQHLSSVFSSIEAILGTDKTKYSNNKDKNIHNSNNNNYSSHILDTPTQVSSSSNQFSHKNKAMNSSISRNTPNTRRSNINKPKTITISSPSSSSSPSSVSLGIVSSPPSRTTPRPVIISSSAALNKRNNTLSPSLPAKPLSLTPTPAQRLAKEREHAYITKQRGIQTNDIISSPISSSSSSSTKPIRLYESGLFVDFSHTDGTIGHPLSLYSHDSILNNIPLNIYNTTLHNSNSSNSYSNNIRSINNTNTHATNHRISDRSIQLSSQLHALSHHNHITHLSNEMDVISQLTQQAVFHSPQPSSSSSLLSSSILHTDDKPIMNEDLDHDNSNNRKTTATSTSTNTTPTNSNTNTTPASTRTNTTPTNTSTTPTSLPTSTPYYHLFSPLGPSLYIPPRISSTIYYQPDEITSIQASYPHIPLSMRSEFAHDAQNQQYKYNIDPYTPQSLSRYIYNLPNDSNDIIYQTEYSHQAKLLHQQKQEYIQCIQQLSKPNIIPTYYPSSIITSYSSICSQLLVFLTYFFYVKYHSIIPRMSLSEQNISKELLTYGTRFINALSPAVKNQYIIQVNNDEIRLDNIIKRCNQRKNNVIRSISSIVVPNGGATQKTKTSLAGSTPEELLSQSNNNNSKATIVSNGTNSSPRHDPEYIPQVTTSPPKDSQDIMSHYLEAQIEHCPPSRRLRDLISGRVQLGTDDIIYQCKIGDVTSAALETLRVGNWLSNDIINCYLWLIIERSRRYELIQNKVAEKIKKYRHKQAQELIKLHGEKILPSTHPMLNTTTGTTTSSSAISTALPRSTPPPCSQNSSNLQHTPLSPSLPPSSKQLLPGTTPLTPEESFPLPMSYQSIPIIDDLESGPLVDFHLPRVWAHSTFFFVQMETKTQQIRAKEGSRDKTLIYDYTTVSRWSKRNNVIINNMDLLLVPCHMNGNHWTLLAADLIGRTITYYDPQGGSNHQGKADALLRYLYDEWVTYGGKNGYEKQDYVELEKKKYEKRVNNQNSSLPSSSSVSSSLLESSQQKPTHDNDASLLDKTNQRKPHTSYKVSTSKDDLILASYDYRPFEIKIAHNIPLQDNLNDCGVFTCMYANVLSLGIGIEGYNELWYKQRISDLNKTIALMDSEIDKQRGIIMSLSSTKTSCDTTIKNENSPTDITSFSSSSSSSSLSSLHEMTKNDNNNNDNTKYQHYLSLKGLLIRRIAIYDLRSRFKFLLLHTQEPHFNTGDLRHVFNAKNIPDCRRSIALALANAQLS